MRIKQDEIGMALFVFFLALDSGLKNWNGEGVSSSLKTKHVGANAPKVLQCI